MSKQSKQVSQTYSPVARAFRDMWGRSGLTLRAIVDEINNEFHYEITEQRLSNYIRYNGRFPADIELLSAIIQIFRRLPEHKRCSVAEAVEFLTLTGLTSPTISIRFECYFAEDLDAFNDACIYYKVRVPVHIPFAHEKDIDPQGEIKASRVDRGIFSSSGDSDHPIGDILVNSPENKVQDFHQPRHLLHFWTQPKMLLPLSFMLLAGCFAVICLLSPMFRAPFNIDADGADVIFESIGIVDLVPQNGSFIQATWGQGQILQHTRIPAGQPITVTFIVQNNDSHGIQIRELVIGARGPAVACNGKWEGPVIRFSPVSNIALKPGERYIYQSSRILYLPGTYYIEPNIYLDNWGGFDPTQRICFTVITP